MISGRIASAVLAGGIMLAGCGTELWSSSSDEEGAAGSGTSARIEIPPSTAGTAPSSGDAKRTGSGAAGGIMPKVEPRPVAIQPKLVSTSTGTFVGRKIDGMRKDLVKLKSAVGRLDKRLRQVRGGTSGATQRYHGVVAAMNAKLQGGTTPGNPVLVQQWNEAQKQLKLIEGVLASMNSLSIDAGAEASVAGYLLDSVRATYALSGAIDADHVQLRALEDETNLSVVVIDRLLNEVADDLSRHTGYLANERRNLGAMSIAIRNGERYGASLTNRAFAQAEVKASMAARAGPSSGDRPLVVIRFDRQRVAYHRALYNAVSRALERKPQAAFDLVAVSPKTGSAAQVVLNTTAAKRSAEDVLRSLAQMGLATTRLSLTSVISMAAQSNEVRVYVR